MITQIKTIVSHVIALLVAKDYQQVVRLTNGIRLDVNQMRQAITDYGRTLTIPPENAFDLLDVRKAKNPNIERWSVWMPLWTQEEGRSDLTLQLSITRINDKMEVQVDDIRVL